MPVLPAGNLAGLDEPGSCIVCVLRIEEDGYTVPLDACHIIKRLPAGLCSPPQVKGSTGIQQFPHASRVRHMTDYLLPAEFRLGNEPVGAAEKTCGQQMALFSDHLFPSFCVKWRQEFCRHHYNAWKDACPERLSRC